MQKVSLSKIVSFIALLLVFFAGTALADAEWTSISGTSNVFNTNLGRVGIGTNSPTANLEIKANAENNEQLLFLKNFAGTRYYFGVTKADSGHRFLIGGNGGNALSIDPLSNVGIGTTNPGAKLTVNKNAIDLPTPLTGTVVHIGQADATLNFLLLDAFGAGNAVVGRRANNTNASPSALLNGQGLLNMLGYGYGATGYSSGPRAQIMFFTAQDWTDTAQGTLISFKVTPNNSTTLAEAMRIDNSGNVGIGTVSPTKKLSVAGQIQAAGSSDYNRIEVIGTAADYNNNGFRLSDNYHHFNMAIDSSGNYLLNEYTGSTWLNRFTIKNGGNIGIGTTNPQSTLAVNGTITTKKVKVTETGWSDFVFNAGYKLPSLAAVESHIKQYKHLPGIPSAQEIQKKGLDISEVLAKQMQKIEELTLYMIEMKKENQAMQKENQDLKNRLNTLEKQVTRN